MALFLCVLWGGLIPALKLSLEGIPPLGVAAWRFLIGWSCIVGWCLLAGIEWRVPKRQHGPLLLLSLVFVFQIGAINLGSALTSGSHAVVLLNTSPLFTALLAHRFISGDRLSGRRSAGLGAAFVGIALIFVEAPPAGSLLWGNILSLTSGMLLALLFILSKKLLQSLSPYQLLVWEMAYGIPLFFGLSFLLEGGEPYVLTAPVLGGLLYQGIVVAGFCFVAWNHLLQKHPAGQLTSFQFTIPVFGLVLSRFVLAEWITGRFVAGVSLVTLGIYLVTTVRNPRKADEVKPNPPGPG
jgi:drug/metabolite transporter (DMT)-like permease